MTTKAAMTAQTSSPSPTSAVVVATLTADEITALLQGAGVVDTASNTFNRMKVDGSMFVAGDEVYPYNPVKGEPAFVARIVAPPEQYQGFWFNEKTAAYANRLDMANHMCKSYYDVPNQARKFSENGASCDACPFNPFRPAPMDGEGRCAWKGDLNLQILPPDGVLTGEETIWTLTLSMTGMIEWRGTRKAPSAGSASEFNFMHKLANFAVSQAEAWSVSPQEAISIALTSYNLGGVAAEFRLVRQTTDDKSRSWNVVSATPIYVEPITEEVAPAIEAGDDFSGVLDGEQPIPF